MQMVQKMRIAINVLSGVFLLCAIVFGDSLGVAFVVALFGVPFLLLPSALITLIINNIRVSERRGRSDYKFICDIKYIIFLFTGTFFIASLAQEGSQPVASFICMIATVFATAYLGLELTQNAAIAGIPDMSASKEPSVHATQPPVAAKNMNANSSPDKGKVLKNIARCIENAELSGLICDTAIKYDKLIQLLKIRPQFSQKAMVVQQYINYLIKSLEYYDTVENERLDSAESRQTMANIAQLAKDMNIAFSNIYNDIHSNDLSKIDAEVDAMRNEMKMRGLV